MGPRLSALASDSALVELSLSLSLCQTKTMNPVLWMHIVLSEKYFIKTRGEPVTMHIIIFRRIKANVSTLYFANIYNS